MFARAKTATAMAFRDQARRPLVPILLVIVPLFIVAWSVAITKPESQRIRLSGDVWVTTTMKDLHGPEMAKFTIAFVCALLGVFVMRSALQGDKRLVVAGLHPAEAILARLLVLLAAAAIVVGVSAGVVALQFNPAAWLLVLTGLVLAALIYTAIGAIVGVLLDKVAATYVILFVVAADLSVIQTPMFHPEPSRYAALLPGYGPTRVMLDGAFAAQLHAGRPALFGLAWLVVLGGVAYFVLRRAIYPAGVSSRS